MRVSGRGFLVVEAIKVAILSSEIFILIQLLLAKFVPKKSDNFWSASWYCSSWSDSGRGEAFRDGSICSVSYDLD